MYIKIRQMIHRRLKTPPKADKDFLMEPRLAVSPDSRAACAVRCLGRMRKKSKHHAMMATRMAMWKLTWLLKVSISDRKTARPRTGTSAEM